MTEMSDMLRNDRPLNVYNKLTNKCEVTSGPSSRKQVLDKNYNDKKKQRIQDLGHSVSRGNIADHINEIDKMLAAICRLCREEITKATTNYNGPVFDKHETVTEAEQTHLQDVEESSQSSTMSSLQTADSQESYASVMNISRLESLNTFLHNCNVSPVKKFIKLINSSKNEQEQPADDTLQILKKIYIQAESWQFQRQVLSIIVQQMSFEGAQKFIPGLTSWRFYEAKRHANIEGPGLPVNVTVEKREKINANSLDHFIDFITSSHIMKDLPYGQRTLKLDSGEIINIPNVIRSLSSSSLISQYLQLCEEDNISPLECAASVRKKSVEGLDNYVMEGSRAFQTLEEIFMDENNLKTKLLEAKRYLKADFKVEKAVNDIKNLQKHIVRSKNQEFARKDIADNMEINDVIITSDWAMKFLPRRYREGQLDWFAKRGINWHVSVSLIKLQHRMQTLTHLHIFSSQTSQDAAVTTAVMTDVVQDLKTILPNLQNVHIFSDNAGPCDRRAAHAKFVIKRFINEGRDVTSALDMKKRNLDKKAYRVRVVDTVLDLDAEKHKESIKNVSNFYNFNFADDGLRMWQAYNIGEGKLVHWDSIKPSKNAVQLKVISDWTDIAISDSYEGQQIGSYFCRLAQQDRNSDSNDYRAADEENRRSILKKEITKTIDI
ncbi:unnamed protein product [Mytilus coruscus]|uniref:Uncharacterized protein n=1 Tax=Mytilus coruscus TaxID=42192 RepID=A0A6J8DK89_MYTCO|nr:unnamed protein product [Mytilus coruscus]